ncbi:hypothetical protein [Oryzifoliimicrobium ureilyticus]|uniref:hypothetical protein n=1 Tax=Oryzifoliimicrobium ureilyticus TaxID=3113724 RepID=UPI0030764B5C
MAKKEKSDVELLKTWRLPPTATLGSAVRAKGILLELRARLPSATKKALDLDAGELTLVLPAQAKALFNATSAAITDALKSLDQIPVIPREIEDILSITTTERHRWLNDGRLASAGIRTVRLRGRAKKITFHVFDPKFVEDLLDRGAVDEWREQDALAKIENRRRAAYQAKLTRSLRKQSATSKPHHDDVEKAAKELLDWDQFGSEGLLR